jgi:alpha-L-fucosidase
MLQHGDPLGTAWRPAEADVSIRPGWFYHPAEDEKVRSADDLVELYFTSVGRNSKLLLNVPPTRAGRLHPTDVARLRAARRHVDRLFEEDLATEPRTSWRRASFRGSETVIDLGRTETAGMARLEEDITQGQMVARYTLYFSDGGDWGVLSTGTTIGYTKLDRFDPVSVRRIRLVVEDAVAPPGPVRIKLYG